MLETLLVGLAGVLGALCRYMISQIGFVSSSSDAIIFPWETLACNLIGSWLLGYLAEIGGTYFSPRLRLSLTTGFIGAFTTFSTFSYETMQLLKQGFVGTACLYVWVSLIGGLLLAFYGVVVGKKQLSMRKRQQQ